MTQSCCLHCQLRFSRETAAKLSVCPVCVRPLARVSPQEALGIRLIALDWLAADAPAVQRAVGRLVTAPLGEP